jgi:hypothetical protein
VKITVSSSRKVGQPDYGSVGAVCGLELDVDQAMLDQPGLLAERIRSAFAIAEGAVDEQLGRTTAAAPEPVHQAPRVPDRLSGRAPLPEPARRPPVDDWEEDPDDPPDRGSGAYYRQHPRGETDDDPPTDARQFLGWLAKQPDATKNRVKRIASSWKLPGRYKSWHPEDVRAVVEELARRPPPPASNGHASGTGRNNGYH